MSSERSVPSTPVRDQLGNHIDRPQKRGRAEAESEIPNTTTGSALYESPFSGQSPGSGGWSLVLGERRGA